MEKTIPGMGHNSINLDSVNDEIIKNSIDKMRPPKEMGIICIDITNKCDLACSNCTRLLANQDHFWDMSLENFEKACISLKDYQGLVILIGGNPCMHPKFKTICEIFTKLRPEKKKRGLWTNNFFKHEKISLETFGKFNLNTHGDSRAEKSLKNFEFQNVYHPGNSEHAPILTAIKDLIKNKDEMWKIISNCDVNKNWSASIVENKGKLRAYFCEVAASFDLARGTDNGIEVTDNWWKNEIKLYSDQIKHFCPGCGVSAKLSGHLDKDETDTYTISNSDIAERSREKKGRNIIKIDKIEDIKKINHEVTTYSGLLKRDYKYKIKKLLWKVRKLKAHLFD